MKYLLLDHDGVMVTKQLFGWRHRHPNNFDWDRFDIKCVRVLNRIIIETDCEIVVSSDWCRESDLNKFINFYKSMGVIKTPISMIELNPINSDTKYISKLEGITNWLDNNIKPSDNWLVVDDLDMGSLINEIYGIEHFIQCKYQMEGIKQSGLVDKIIKILNE